MKKQGATEIILYLITGLLQLLAYYFLMTEYFKISPFKGYYLILTIYFLLAYILYPFAGRRISEATLDKEISWVFPSKTQLLFAFILAPFIMIWSFCVRKNN